mmetsp:Transcript_15948/g.36769  ORF Transcript_15948/g.36769 Transcript_15948/m.36769 type:complete len:387 (+) Transcript_15948:282-1442(+)
MGMKMGKVLQPLLVILCMVVTPLVDSFSASDALALSRRLSPTWDTCVYGQTVAELEAECDVLREEIKVLKKEALDKIDRLLGELGAPSEPSSSTPVETTVADDDLLPAPTPITFTGPNENTSTSRSKKPKKTISNLLDQTQWMVNLNIGREPGTWMPKDWGVSGTRLQITFNAEFTSSQLYAKDDFLVGGYADAKILHVLDNEIKLSPSVTEGGRIFRVKDGGWQISQGDGPLGTNVLRFYIEVDEEITHSGSDVVVPQGRIYCSCGYFVTGKDSDSFKKEALEQELKGIDEKINELQDRKSALGLFNLDGIKLSREMSKLEKQAERVVGQLNYAAITEPDSRILRFSEDGTVGLTKEGGVCCQVKKGPLLEYHILGRFGIKCSRT